MVTGFVKLYFCGSQPSEVTVKVLVVLNDEVNVTVGADVRAVLIGALEIYLEVWSVQTGVVRFKVSVSRWPSGQKCN